MNWHERYLHQSAWTRELRRYVLRRCNWSAAQRALEVGCGTGAILMDPAAGSGESSPELHGLDLASTALNECRTHALAAHLTRGDALSLPYAARSFDITFCHFLLLWLQEPLRALEEMKRVTRPFGYVIALAEPDYGARVDEPSELAALGQLQNQALRRQGAALRLGAELAGLFHRAGIRVLETGRIQQPEHQVLSAVEWESEWEVLAADLAHLPAGEEIKRMQAADRKAWLRGERSLSVPTYFAWGQV